MFHFGFSYVGLIYLLMLFIPNIIWTKYQPPNYEQYAQKENKVLQIIEKMGEVLMYCCVLIFSDFNIRLNSIWSIWLLISFMLMLLYEVYWIRYFRSEKNMSDFYSNICGIPVAGATLPVCAFFILGVYGSNVFLILSTIILGIGHIGIHLSHYNKISEGTKKKSVLFRIVKWIIYIFLLILLGITIVIIGCRNFNYIDLHINNEKGVNTTNPVIIWLPGGPSSPDTFVNYIFQKHLLEDLNDLVNYARNRFRTEKIIIVGHSSGTMLGSRYVLNHPEKVTAYIGVGQVITMESDIYSYEDALEKAVAMGDDTSEMEAAYQKYIADKSLVNMMNLRNYSGKYHVAEKAANTIQEGIASPYMGIGDARCFLKQAGNFDEEDTPMAKAGNRYLRYYLGEAANNMRKHNVEYGAYYRKKYNEVPKHQHNQL